MDRNLNVLEKSREIRDEVRHDLEGRFGIADDEVFAQIINKQVIKGNTLKATLSEIELNPVLTATIAPKASEEVVNYSIDQQTAQTLYRTVGKNYYDNIMYPRIQENTKAVFSQYTAENLISQRETLSSTIADLLREDISSYGITIISVAVEDIDFTDAFTNAVEAKQVAAQNKLTAETEQAQKTMEEQAAAERAIITANAKAQQDIIAAQADLEVVKIQADAALYAGEREANMNERIASALSDKLINYYWIKQWDGKLPTTVLGTDSNYMIDLAN